MVHIPSPSNKRLVWYLAMEEYIGQHVADYPDGVFFTWSVDPTVIFGRHQVMQQEVNIDYCRSHGVNMFRRKSGGGCVYADRGNLMLSYIVPSTHSQEVFAQYLDEVVRLLSGLGFAAVKSEHNDVLVDGYKVSGNACYALPKGTIVHGTMLYDVDFDALQQAITPSKQKLAKHGVSSVRQRVMNLRGCMPQTVAAKQIVSLSELSDYFVTGLCNKTLSLTEEQMRAIDAIETTYLDPEFISHSS